MLHDYSLFPCHAEMEMERQMWSWRSEPLKSEETSPAGVCFIIAQDRVSLLRFVVIIKLPRKTGTIFFCPGIYLLSVDAHSRNQEYAPTSGLWSELLLLLPWGAAGQAKQWGAGSTPGDKMSCFHSVLWKILKALMSEGICTPAEKTSHLILSLAKSRSFLLSHKLPDNTTYIKIGAIAVQIMNQLSWMLLLRQFLSEIKIGSLIALFRRMLGMPEIRLNAINLTKQFRRNYHINVKSKWRHYHMNTLIA